MTKLLVPVLFVTLLAGAEPRPPEPFNYPPGVALSWEFPDLPQTVFTQTFPEEAPYHPARLSILIPKNYDPAKTYPMVVFLAGWHGGRGYPNPKFDRQFGADTVCVYLPLFKKSVEPLSEDESNKWSRTSPKPEDGDTIWACYKTMIEKVYELVPNIDRKRTFMGGFSNGGHTMAILLNRPNADKEICSLIRNFYLMEGGTRLEKFEALKDSPIVFFQGEKHETKRLEPVYRAALAAGVPAQWRIIKGVGHEMTPECLVDLRAWMENPTAKATTTAPAE